MSTPPSKKQKLTLEEYLQAHKFKKKIEERNRSRSKGRKQSDSNFVIEHQKSMQNVFQFMNSFLNEVKLDLSELFQKKMTKDKIFIEISALLDKFILKLKEEIKKMYKDIYTLITVQNQTKGLTETQQTMTYFKDKVSQAEEQIKKSKLIEVVKDNFKTEDKHKQICDIMVSKMSKPQQQTLNVPGGTSNQPASFMEALLGMSTQSVEVKQNSETHSNEEKNQPQTKVKENRPMIQTVSTKSPKGRQPQRKHNPRSPRSKQKP